LRWLPNALTFFRLGSSPILVWLLVRQSYRAALLLTLVAGLTDWFDGYAARRLARISHIPSVGLDSLSESGSGADSQSSASRLFGTHGSSDTREKSALPNGGGTAAIGVLFDPLADKALLVTLFVALGVLRLIPFWMLGLAIGRDLIIVAGALLLRIFRGKQRFVPSTLGKVSTFFQIVLVLLVLLEAAFPYPLFQWLSYLALLLAAIFTALSGLDYIRLGIRIARRRIDGTSGGE
jgi:cardiolipin synthase